MSALADDETSAHIQDNTDLAAGIEELIVPDALAAWTSTDDDELAYTDNTNRTLLEVAETQAIASGRLLVISNISKKPNIIQLLMLAKAHRFIPVLVSSRKISTLELIKLHCPFFRLADMDECRTWLKTHNIPLLGIEIMDSAVSVDAEPFFDRIAFMPGNEGTGLSDAQKRACDGYVIIPQYGKASASLNVHIATCIVLYRYVAWTRDTTDTGIAADDTGAQS